MLSISISIYIDMIDIKMVHTFWNDHFFSYQPLEFMMLRQLDNQYVLIRVGIFSNAVQYLEPYTKKCTFQETLCKKYK